MKAAIQKVVEAHASNGAALTRLALQCASSFRQTDYLGGCNGARIRLEPQIGWEANEPDRLRRVLDVLEPIAEAHGASLADTIVLAGNVGIEMAAKAGGLDVDVPFAPGRGDASAEMTEVESFKWLKPLADGFRNYISSDVPRSAQEEMLLDQAQLLGQRKLRSPARPMAIRRNGNCPVRKHTMVTHRSHAQDRHKKPKTAARNHS